MPGLFIGKNGKLNYAEHYKLKRGRRNPANGEQLVNPGKLLKGRGLLKHKNDAEFSGRFCVLPWKLQNSRPGLDLHMLNFRKICLNNTVNISFNINQTHGSLVKQTKCLLLPFAVIKTAPSPSMAQVAMR